MNKFTLLKKLDGAKTALVELQDFKTAMAVRDAADKLQQEIAAEDDAGPPKRASLLAMEYSCRACGETSARPVGDVATHLVQAADVLCALREVVVPKLLQMKMPVGDFEWDVQSVARNLLSALEGDAT